MVNFKKYFLSLIKDQRSSFFDNIVKFLLLLISAFYWVAINVVDIFYKTGIRKVFKSDIPVVSIGNITLGGTGKTPFSIFVAEYLRSKQKLPAILIRGYGNDECRMLKNELPDIGVYVGQSRKKSLLNASDAGCDVAILDDGFQHRTVERDLDIVLVDGRSFFGNEKLFPRGVLRERLSSLKRADMIVITKIDSSCGVWCEENIKNIKDIARNIPIITARHEISVLTDVTGSVYSPDHFKDKRILLVSGIGDPDYFSFLIERNISETISHMVYGDHFLYDQVDINRILGKSNDFDADAIITTKKDFVKMKDLDISLIEDKLFMLNVTMEIVNGKEELFAGLDSVISNKSA